MESNTLLIIGVVLITLLVIVLVPWGGKCKCSEAYKSSNSAQFTVNRPKNTVPHSYPMKSTEGYIIPTPTKAQTIKSNNVNGGFMAPTSMPMMGAMVGEAKYGTSVPGTNSATTMSGNGGQNPESLAVWRTVI